MFNQNPNAMQTSKALVVEQLPTYPILPLSVKLVRYYIMLGVMIAVILGVSLLDI
jgi:hypothetical protein